MVYYTCKKEPPKEYRYLFRPYGRGFRVEVFKGLGV